MTALTAMPENDIAEFRRTLGCFPTGVAIVTTCAPDGAPIGLTISSFNSVSMDPPLILWSLGLNALSLPVFREAGGFVINVLSAEQADLPRLFSSPVDERFDSVAWTQGLEGRPILDDAAAVMECRTHAMYEGGDHEIILGEVVRHRSTDRTPLVFGKGRMTALT